MEVGEEGETENIIYMTFSIKIIKINYPHHTGSHMPYLENLSPFLEVDAVIISRNKECDSAMCQCIG